MSVTTLISNSQEAEGMVRWSILFGLAKEIDALHILHTSSLTENDLQHIIDQWALDRAKPEKITFAEIDPQIDERAILKEIDKVSTSLLILGQNRLGESTQDTLLRIRRIYDKALCDCIILRLGNRAVEEADHVLVPTAGGPHSRIALELGSKLCQLDHGKIVPLFIESDIGEEDGLAVGLRILNRMVDKAGLDRTDKDHVKPQIVVSNDVGRGIARAAREKPYDLILVGASNSLVIKRKLFGILPTKFFDGEDAMTVALLRKRRPVGSRFRQRMERFITFRIPQLERDDRVALFDRLQTQSVWSFDFVTLILLSTGIAALGLIQSSAAVVIGAMLVAPLMTPLLGSGLSLVQGNLPLMKDCIKAILLGFLAALCFGSLIGFITPIEELTSELASRGSPGLLDFGVAALSGIAASYCVARPSLSSALAGVAIAAALVPPIATVGISLALQQWTNATGAALLFGTNVVTIIFASAITFFAIGVRGQVGAKTLWARRTMILLALLFIPITTLLINQNIDSLSSSKTVVHESLEKTLKQAKFDYSGIQIVTYKHTSEQIQIDCEIASPKPITQATYQLLKDSIAVNYPAKSIKLSIRSKIVMTGQ